MKHFLIATLLIASLLAACGPAPTPQPTPDINATIQALSGTMVASTLTAQPTSTPRPTETPTLTATATSTATALPTETATPTITLTAPVLQGCFAPAGVGNIRNDMLRLENNTKETLHIYLNGTSFTGNVTVNCSYIVNLSYNVFVIWGNYSYSVQIGTKRTIEGTFIINNDDKTTMRVYDKKVVVVGP